MLKNLLKYDFKSILKDITPMYLLSIISILITFIFEKILTFIPNHELILNFFYIPTCFILAATLCYSLFSSIKRYYTNVLKDEGYLTNTLPVKTSKIVISKLLSGTTISLVTILFVILGFIFLTKTPLKFENIYTFFALTIATNIAASISMYFLALALGHKHSTNKIVCSVLYGVIIYTIMQMIGGTLVIIFGYTQLGSFEAMDKMNNSMAMDDIVYPLLALVMIFNVLCLIVCTSITINILEKKLNLD